MRRDSMDNSLNSLFRRITRANRQIVQDYLAGFDLYIGQPRILNVIQSNPGITQKELVEILKLTKESVSVSLRRLEKAERIQRVVNTTDRREKQLFLTQKGKALVEELNVNFEKIDSALFSALTDEQQDQLAQLFQIMLEDIEKGEDE